VPVLSPALSTACPEQSRRVEGPVPSPACPEQSRRVEGPVLSPVEGPVLSPSASLGINSVEGPVLSLVEGPVLSLVEGPVLSLVEGPVLSLPKGAPSCPSLPPRCPELAEGPWLHTPSGRCRVASRSPGRPRWGCPRRPSGPRRQIYLFDNRHDIVYTPNSRYLKLSEEHTEADGRTASAAYQHRS
jgi:hypothetical protein